jgi:methylenetetrahydrofolate reductase (NADPH)
VEVFPPKTAEAEPNLMETLQRLAAYAPDFVSCTYGAGGSTRDRTLHWCRRIRAQFGLTPVAHLTCVGSPRAELVDWLSEAGQSGVRSIMALRGDPPRGERSFQGVPDGLNHADELVTLIRQTFPDFAVGVAGYPEKHPEAPTLAADLENLKRKVDAGADAIFTQMFYDNASFLVFRERCERIGIHVPLVPGIMPLTDLARVQRISALCGAVIPAGLVGRLESVRNDRRAQFEIGVEYATAQCRELIDQEVPGLHFFALNQARACEAILEALRIRPALARSA